MRSTRRACGVRVSVDARLLRAVRTFSRWSLLTPVGHWLTAGRGERASLHHRRGDRPVHRGCHAMLEGGRTRGVHWVHRPQSNGRGRDSRHWRCAQGTLARRWSREAGRCQGDLLLPQRTYSNLLADSLLKEPPDRPHPGAARGHASHRCGDCAPVHDNALEASFKEVR